MSRRSQTFVWLAAASGAAAVAVWVVGLHLQAGRQLDARALGSFADVAPHHLTSSIDGVARLADPKPVLLGTAMLVVVALLRRRWMMAAAVPAILVLANATTQVLKPGLGDMRVVDYGTFAQIFQGSWPSGHSTAAMSLALCFVLVIGPRLRSLAALLGAGYAIAVGYSLVALGHHLPSDVFGGYLVAAMFTLLGAAALDVLESRRPARVLTTMQPPQALSAPVLAAGAVVLVALSGAALLIDHPTSTVEALGHTSAVMVAVAIAALGLTLTGGLARVLRRP